ncbi:MFS transporter [Burkholderia sp. FERM BP-3421]|uniref:MFS transporter n=1 Tax=Burkholderia sp. FERM BP-3421 TaxID=1494466 RepID=UPI00235F6AA0|nr:MFS transporter [Burkholderia sp. FERM BP-3421]WDD93709.1 MFS transporter [Burkholderia sp. FERM BP-3421]
MNATNCAAPARRAEPISAVPPYRSLWAACFLGYASIGMTIQVMPSFTHDRLDANAVVAGLAVTIGSLATMLSRPFAGRFADVRGSRPIVIAGALLGVLGGLLHLVAATLPVLILARLVLGAGEGALFTGCIGWVLAHAEPSRRGKIAGHFGLSMWAGLACGPMLGAAVLVIGGYREVWMVASVLPAVGAALIARTPRLPGPAAAPSARRALLPRAAWSPGVSGALAGIGYGVIAAFLVPRVAALHLVGQDLVLAAFGAAFLIVRFAGSQTVDRLGAPRMLLIALLTEALGLYALSVAAHAPAVFAATMLTGAGLAMLYPCLASLVTEAAAAHERSTALGTLTSAWDLGIAVSGPLGGFVAGHAHAGSFMLGAVSALLAAAPLIVRLGKRRASAA